MAATRRIVHGSVDPSGEFPLAADDYILHLLVAISQLRDTTLDGLLRPFGLNVGRYRVLGVLDRLDACSMTEVANFTAIDRTTLTRVADQLVSTGFVERRADAKDRRQVLLAITDVGRERFSQAISIVRGLNDKLLDDVPEESRRSTARVLMHLVEQLAPNQAARTGLLNVTREARNEANTAKKR